MNSNFLQDLLAESFDSCYYYATDQMEKFMEVTDGQRHQALVKWVMMYKHTNSLIRERIVAKALDLEHNTKVHSTYKGVTTFDATDNNGNYYEIKTEQYNVGNDDREIAYGQLSGTGLFGNIINHEDAKKLQESNPMIAHGMFINGKLVSISTFRLSDAPDAFSRIVKYASSDKRTVPRYMFSDWKSCKNLTVNMFSHSWPDTVAPSYKKFFARKWTEQQLLPIATGS